MRPSVNLLPLNRTLRDSTESGAFLMVCVDDYGSEIHRCHWTNKLVKAEDSVITGSFYPGSRNKFIAVKDHKEAKQRSYILFVDSERNCNTCKHLTRHPIKKDKAGFLYGVCKSNPIDHPYSKTKEIMFPPDDWMGMECYESRYE